MKNKDNLEWLFIGVLVTLRGRNPI